MMCFVVIAPCGAGKLGWYVSGIRVDYGCVALFVLVSEFCDEEKVTNPIKGLFIIKETFTFIECLFNSKIKIKKC